MRIFHRRSRATDHIVPVRRAAGARGNGAVAPVGATLLGATPLGAAPVSATPGGAVNGYAVLESVAALPISTWRYLWEPEEVRHVGPMAQDWHAAFGFNQDDTAIPVVDGLGVALVCVQALHRRVEELTVEVECLREAASLTRAAAPGASPTECVPGRQPGPAAGFGESAPA